MTEQRVAKQGNRAKDRGEHEVCLVRFFTPEHPEETEQCWKRGTPKEEPQRSEHCWARGAHPQDPEETGHWWGRGDEVSDPDTGLEGKGHSTLRRRGG